MPERDIPQRAAAGDGVALVHTGSGGQGYDIWEAIIVEPTINQIPTMTNMAPKTRTNFW
jgi:hypothetical protein